MNVLVSGASGLIGSAMARCSSAQRHRIVPLVRRTTTGPAAQAWWNPSTREIDLHRSGPLDAVVHLAGETVAQRWSAKAKQRIRDSRVEGTRLLCEALVGLRHPPSVLVCASACGFYGHRGDEWLEETSAAGTGFLADVVQAWEAATSSAVAAGIRVIHLRLGIVLAAEGGALGRMLPVFRLGMGGALGEGKAYWSWIAVDDVVELIDYALANDQLQGPVNAVAPNPVTNACFTRSLGRVLRRPTVFTVPRFAVELLFGEMGREALLASFRVRPAKLLAAGFPFRYAELEPALRHLLATA